MINIVQIIEQTINRTDILLPGKKFILNLYLQMINKLNFKTLKKCNCIMRLNGAKINSEQITK